MNTELVIDVRAEEVVIALLKDKRLAELTTEKTSAKFAVGDIYYGRVKKIMPGLNAAFVNIGYEKDAFLHYLDLSPQFNSLNSYIKQCIARKGMPVSKLKLEPEINKNGKISDVLSVGQYVAVQVAKEPISTKGPRLTSELSLAGRHLVLIPLSNKVHISQKIRSNEEKTSFSFPLGAGDPKKAIDKLMEDCREKGIPLVFHGISREMEQYLEENYPGKFEVEFDRDIADYVYETQALIELKGRKYHGKKNHINKFNKTYDWSYEAITSENTQECLDMLKDGINGVRFDDIFKSLAYNDPYMVLKDFDSYAQAQLKINDLYLDQKKWQQMSLINTAKSGIFCADRSIRDYAERIWRL